ncbi:trypsin-like serine protease [Micromonospora yasonensis]|uniref:trypsin-like serine protease n=1 Tax=Micromonospora yasonensis TaxID=1128667 RepID=UPI00222F8EDA|nr:trypsin-like serine protease [Micromonospora yasonensis]MCW3845217.1 trypsin-like serine protease [Micromonospora yasonensis]
MAGILAAGLALGGAAAVAPGTAGQAAPAGGAYDASSVQAGRSTKLPHFRAGNFTPPTPGQKGPLFQSTGTGATPRIVGGTTVSASQYPWIVGVVTYLDGNAGIGWCTGTVIAPNKVLTAAHCTADGAGTTRVIAGHDQLLDASGNIIPNVGYVAEVGSTWTHQGWNIAAQYAKTASTILDDVSVLTLKANLPSAYTPVPLAGQGEAAYTAGVDTADIVGYGVTDSNTDPGDTRLRKASVPIQSDTDCAADANAAGIGYDAGRMLCAGNGTPSAPSADTCGGDSGGPLLVNGKQVGLTDWGYGNCGEHPGFYEEINYYSNLIKADLTRPTLVNADWTGDGHTDLMSRDGSGRLWLHVGSGFSNDGWGGFWDSRVVGTGFGSFKRVFRVYNWNGDKKPSVMAVNSLGELWIWNTDGKGNWYGSKKRIGTGWGNFTALMVTNNWLGNNLPSLMVRKSNGELWRYTSDGKGGWTNPAGTRIGTGWNGFNLFLTPGAWKGDGKEVLIGRTSTGYLRMYQTDLKGGWTNPAGTQIGSGWANYKNIITPGDWNGDNMMDMLGVNSTYQMRQYTTNGYGSWIDASGKVISTGWNAYNLVF